MNQIFKYLGKGLSYLKNVYHILMQISFQDVVYYRIPVRQTF